MKQRKDLERLENVIGKVKNPPEGQGGTPEIDKYMKMNERPSKELRRTIGGYSTHHPIEKANLAIYKGLDLMTFGYSTRKLKDNISKAQDEKEKAEARKELPARPTIHPIHPKHMQGSPIKKVK